MVHFSPNEMRAIELMQERLNIHEPLTTELLAGGLSGSKVFKINTFNKAYVVRFWNAEWADYFPQDLACQLIASEAGYGPRVYFYNEAEGITIMEYRCPEPLPERKVQLQALVDLLKKIHSGPALPKGIDRSVYLDLLIEETKSTRFFDPEVIREIKNRVFSVTRSNAMCVPCHRDLHHGNLLYNQGSFFSIDYTWGAMDDPYTDLANIAVFNCETPEEEQLLLHLYFGRAPNPLEMARLSLMKVPVKLFYGLEFLGIASAGLKGQELIPQTILKGYRNFGCHNGAEVSPSDFLNYAHSLLGEVIDYSLSEKYAKDLEEVSNCLLIEEHHSSKFEFNNSALKPTLEK